MNKHPFLPFEYEQSRQFTWLNVKFIKSFGPVVEGQEFHAVDLYIDGEHSYIDCLDDNWDSIWVIPITIKVEPK